MHWIIIREDDWYFTGMKEAEFIGLSLDEDNAKIYDNEILAKQTADKLTMNSVYKYITKEI